MVSPEFVSEAEDAVGAGFGGVEIVFGAFEWGEVFNREVFRKSLDRKAGKIVGHSIESWGFAHGVFIGIWGDAD